jgi:hypothetical protein
LLAAVIPFDIVRSEKILTGSKLLVAFKEKHMKLRDHPPIRSPQGSILKEEIIRARAVSAKLQSNIKKAHELRHTARNLMTVHRLLLEEIHLRSRRNLTNH